MTTKRIQEIQKETAYPDSHSVQQALLQVWNECSQEQPEIIHCKECKYRRDINKRLHYCKLSNIHVDFSHYCSDAKQGEANE